MIKEIIAQGKDVSEAKENARAALGVSELDDVQFVVLHIGSKGIFGVIGVKPAQVKAYIELPDREPKRHERREKKNNNQDKPREAKESTAAAEGEKQAQPANKKGKNKKKGDNSVFHKRTSVLCFLYYTSNRVKKQSPDHVRSGVSY